MKVGTYYLDKPDQCIVKILKFTDEYVKYEIVSDPNGYWVNLDSVQLCSMYVFKTYYSHVPAYDTPLYKALNNG